MQQLERTIALLAGQHFLRISLFRLDFSGVAACRLGSRVREALQPLGMICTLPDGSLGLLYVGPRAGEQDDMALERTMAEKINRLMARVAPSEARLASITAAHRWADEIDGADELIDEAMFTAAAHPLLLRKAS